MENRHGLLVDTCLTPADGHAERVAALAMIEPRADRPRAITLGADKAYDAEDVNELRSITVSRSSAIDGRTTRHSGYAISRKRIEEAFSWIKTVAGQEKTRFRGVGRVGFAFTFRCRGLQSRAIANSWRRLADGQGPRPRQDLCRPLADR
jgi:hypothetical protein